MRKQRGASAPRCPYCGKGLVKHGRDLVCPTDLFVTTLLANSPLRALIGA